MKPTNTPPISTLLGYVYLNQDTDNDGIVDGVEYPPAGVLLSDSLISGIIFKHCFE